MGAFGVYQCEHCAALVDDGADHKCSRRDLIDEIERLRAEVQELRLELIAAYGQQQEAALRGEEG